MIVSHNEIQVINCMILTDKYFHMFAPKHISKWFGIVLKHAQLLEVEIHLLALSWNNIYNALHPFNDKTPYCFPCCSH
jgi:hypothetical protein